MALPHISPLPLPSWTGMLSDFIILCCCDWWWWWCCCWCCWCWGASTVLLLGIEEGGKLLPPAGVPTAPPEAMAGAMSFRPKFNKLLETLLMFRGAALALALKKEEEKSSRHCQWFGQAQPYMHCSSKLGRKKFQNLNITKKVFHYSCTGIHTTTTECAWIFPKHRWTNYFGPSPWTMQTNPKQTEFVSIFLICPPKLKKKKKKSDKKQSRLHRIKNFIKFNFCTYLKAALIYISVRLNSFHCLKWLKPKHVFQQAKLTLDFPFRLAELNVSCSEFTFCQPNHFKPSSF